MPEIAAQKKKPEWKPDLNQRCHEIFTEPSIREGTDKHCHEILSPVLLRGKVIKSKSE